MTRQITVELDDRTARELERIAPSRARKRSEFVRLALRQALDAEAERGMARAYRRRPDDAESEQVDPGSLAAAKVDDARPPAWPLRR